jgi:integrase
MKWPYKVKHRKNGPILARIYKPKAPSKEKPNPYPFYRVTWMMAGKRLSKTFRRFAGKGGAREFAEEQVKGLAQGSQVAALTPGEARSALAVRDALEAHRRETGVTLTPIQVVTECLAAMRLLGKRPLSEAVAGFLGTVATVKRVDLSVAVEEFAAAREIKTKTKDGRRAQLSSTYTYNTGLWLRNFAAEFPGHAVCDLAKEHLDLYFANKKRADLAPKSRNHIRSTLAMFFRWAIKNDYMALNHRLLEAAGMEHETVMGEDTDFFRPTELKTLLEAANDTIRPIIALCGLAGLRQQEALRLTWEDVFHVAGHVEITAAKSKTRSRRLVKMVPALAAWLRPFQDKQGPLWTMSRDTFHAQLADLRTPNNIPVRKNGLRHAYCTYHFALHSNENLTAAQAGNSPAMIHAHYKGLATKKEALAWFAVNPDTAPNGTETAPHKAAVK